MASLDNSTVPFKVNIVSVVLSDAAGTPNTLTLTLLQGSAITWSETGRTVVEARQQGRHQSTPVVVETDDGLVTGSMELLIASFKGSSNVTPKEFFSKTGLAASYTATGAGGAWTWKATATLDSTVDGGGAQTVVFAYCHTDSLDVDPGGMDGLAKMTVSFTDFENRPTYA